MAIEDKTKAADAREGHYVSFASSRSESGTTDEFARMKDYLTHTGALENKETQMSELIELMAEAMRECCEGPRGDFKWADDAGLPQYRKVARAALEAIEAAGYRIVEDEKLLSTKDMYVEFSDADGTTTLTELDKIVVDIVLPEKPK